MHQIGGADRCGGRRVFGIKRRGRRQQLYALVGGGEGGEGRLVITDGGLSLADGRAGCT